MTKNKKIRKIKAKSLDSRNNLLFEADKQRTLKLINDKCRRLAILSSKLNFSEENKQDFDSYLKFVQVYTKYIQAYLTEIRKPEYKVMKPKNN